MAARISTVVCHLCRIESRDGSGLRSVSAFPFDTNAVSLWPRLSPQDQHHTEEGSGCPGLIRLELPICTLYCLICSLGFSKPGQGCCPGLCSPHVGTATVTCPCPCVWSCRGPAAILQPTWAAET